MTPRARAYRAAEACVRSASRARSRSRSAATRSGAMWRSAGGAALMARTLHAGGVRLTRLCSADVVRDEPAPAPAVALVQRRRTLPEPFPAGVHDGHARAGALGGEVDLDARRVAPVLAQVPEIGEPARRLPRQHLAPVVLLARRRALVDAAAGPRLER